MIHLTRINRIPIVLNSDLIEHMESTPDTVISLTSGQKLLVLESPEEVVRRVVVFRQSVLAKAGTDSLKDKNLHGLFQSCVRAEMNREAVESRD